MQVTCLLSPQGFHKQIIPSHTQKQFNHTSLFQGVAWDYDHVYIMIEHWDVFYNLASKTEFDFVGERRRFT